MTKGRSAAPSATVRVRQIRSGIGAPLKQKETLRSMGLRRINQVVELPDNDAVRGMVFAVRHLVVIVETGEA